MPSNPITNILSGVGFNTPAGGVSATTIQDSRNHTALIKGSTGNVVAGLTSLAQIASSIRTGCGTLPSSLTSTPTAGRDWVLQSVGIPQSYLGAVAQFNPLVSSAAATTATNIFTNVVSGHFTIGNINASVGPLQNLFNHGKKIYKPPVNSLHSSTRTVQPYAMDLILRAPKSKFLYVVAFQFKDEYTALTDADFAFVVKHTTRPSTKFEMEDVNYYNFRTKVVTKTTFEEMNMTFHDDVRDTAYTFYRTYMQASTPITNFVPSQSTDALWEEQGMDWDGSLNGGTTAGTVNRQPDATITNTPMADVIQNVNTTKYAATRGILDNDDLSIINTVTLYHVFYDGATRQYLVNITTFLRPRITSLQLDEVDMSVGNEGNQLTMTFNYDSMYMETQTMENISTSQLFPASLARTGTTGLQYIAPTQQSTNGLPGQQHPTPTNTPSCATNPLNTANPITSTIKSIL